MVYRYRGTFPGGYLNPRTYMLKRCPKCKKIQSNRNYYCNRCDAAI